MATVIRLCDVVAERARDEAVAAASTLAERFRIWTGTSGRRHVFTRVGADFEPADLDGAVLVVARRDRDGLSEIETVSLAVDPAAVAAGREIWAHFLAQTEAERAAVAADLVAAATPARWVGPETSRAA